MAVTSTAAVATNCKIEIDNAAGNLADVSGQLNSVEIGMENSPAEFRPFSTQWKIRQVVGKDAPVSIAGVYSTNEAEALGILRGWFYDGVDTARTVQISVPDGDAGADVYSGEFILTSLSIPLDSEADDFIRWSAELLPNGAVTHAEVGS